MDCESRDQDIMPQQTQQPRPLTFKPDLPDAARRWDAFYGRHHRPPRGLRHRARHGAQLPAGRGYHDKVFGDIDDVIGQGAGPRRGHLLGRRSDARLLTPALDPTRSPHSAAPSCAGAMTRATPTGRLPLIEDWERKLSRCACRRSTRSGSACWSCTAARPSAWRARCSSSPRPAHQHGPAGGPARPAAPLPGPDRPPRADRPGHGRRPRHLPRGVEHGGPGGAHGRARLLPRRLTRWRARPSCSATSAA